MKAFACLAWFAVLLFVRSWERAELFNRIARVIINIFTTLQERRGHGPWFAVGALDWRGAVLRKINTTHTVRFVRAAAMKHIAVERHDAASGDDAKSTEVAMITSIKLKPSRAAMRVRSILVSFDQAFAEFR